MKTLYKLSNTGKLLEWRMEIDGDKYRTVSGQVDGKKVESAWTTAKPKNVGRSNETTGEEQARIEVESKYTKKLAQGGYHDSVECVNTSKFVKPMLAKNYEDYQPTKEEYEAGKIRVQPKLDGIRCIATKDGLFTRAGKSIVSCPHIVEQLSSAFEEDPSIVLDGELYNHEYKNDFNAIVSLVRKQKPTEEDLEVSAYKIGYHIYDVVTDLPFSGRSLRLKEIVPARKSLRLVDTYTVTSEEQLREYQDLFLESGYEGLIVRREGESYENKRSKNLLKLKVFDDGEFEVVDILEGEGRDEGIASRAVCRLPNGETFRPNMTGDIEGRRVILQEKNKYIGSDAHVNYFGLTPDGVPRFPRVMHLYQGKRDT